jgi:hypothetical protein
MSVDSWETVAGDQFKITLGKRKQGEEEIEENKDSSKFNIPLTLLGS